MKTLQLPYIEDKERPDIYQLIKTKSQSPQMVIDYIKDHQMMHFGTTNLNEIFNFIILFCYSTNQSKLAEYIFDEFKDEIEVSWLVFKLMEYNVEAVDIDKYFGEYDVVVGSELKMSPNSIFIKTFKEYKDNGNKEYFEMVKDYPNFMSVIIKDYLPTMFTGFQRRMFMQPTAVELLKLLIQENDGFSASFLQVVGGDVEVVETFFPQATDMFIF